jgi:hypothetical protein
MNSHAPAYLQLLGQLNLDAMYLQQVFDFYHQRYLQSELAKLFVAESPRLNAELRLCPLIGFCDRTLGKELPERRTFDGGAIRGSLQRQGLLMTSGHERFRGCVVFPELDAQQNIVAAVGFRIAVRLRHWDKPVVRWHKPEPGSYQQQGFNMVKGVIYGQA